MKISLPILKGMMRWKSSSWFGREWWDENIYPDLERGGEMKISALVWQGKMVWTKDNPEYFEINSHHQPWYWMAPEKASSDLEKKSVQVTMTRKISFLSYAMIGEYFLEPLAYGVHQRGVRLIQLVESPLDKYVGKDRTYGAGLINLWPGSCNQLMEIRAVQKYSHNPWARNTTPQTNFVYICLLYRLCKNQEQSHQKRTRIRLQVHQKFQWWYKRQVTHKGVIT